MGESKFTNEEPTSEGVYWMKDDYGDIEIVKVSIHAHCGGTSYYQRPGSQLFRIEAMCNDKFEWQGPIFPIIGG